MRWKISVKMLNPRILLKTVKQKLLCFFLENNRIIVEIRSTEIPEIIWIPFKCLEPRAEYTVILALSSAQTAAGRMERITFITSLTDKLSLSRNVSVKSTNLAVLLFPVLALHHQSKLSPEVIIQLVVGHWLLYCDEPNI